MARRLTAPLLARAKKIIEKLRDEFPEAKCALHHETPFQLLVATILSAQCTDVRVNLVTPALFAAAPTPEAMAELGLAKIREHVRTINFFNNKAQNIWEAAKIIVHRHGGEVPRSLEELVALPGVGRKTANVVLGNAFGQAAMVVDTHVRRLANRLDLCRSQDVVEIEHALAALFPQADWVDVAHLLILHGRKTCKAQRPSCENCDIRTLCPSRGKDADAWKSP
jgi:endonuclease-3